MDTPYRKFTIARRTFRAQPKDRMAGKRSKCPIEHGRRIIDCMSSPPIEGRFKRITPRALAEQMDRGETPRIIDVREPHEWAIARIETAELKPLSSIREWWLELDRDAAYVFVCHHGVRSAAVCRALVAEGFIDVADIEGGIEGWRVEVDPEMPAY